jgi:hypothetical protein
MRASLVSTVVTVVIAVFGSTVANAHIALLKPAPRTSAQKTGPCGAAGSTRGSTVTTFQPGETIVVEWDETVDHPGHYRIALDLDGDDDFVNPNNPDDNFPTTLVEPIADKVGGKYTQQVTLPTTPCDNCTLQLIQVMTTSVPYNSFYYQCADIVIAGEGGGGGGGDEDEATQGGCSSSRGAGMGVVFLAGLLGLVRRRR